MKKVEKYYVVVRKTSESKINMESWEKEEIQDLEQ